MATQGTYTPSNLPVAGGNVNAENVSTDMNGLINDYNLNIGQSKLTITGQVTMASGTLRGRFGSIGAELPAIPVRTTSASNKVASVPIYYQFPFTSAPTVTLSSTQVLLDSSTGNLTGSSTIAAEHVLDSVGNYIGFLANFTNNANFTSNIHVAIAFTWSATL